MLQVNYQSTNLSANLSPLWGEKYFSTLPITFHIVSFLCRSVSFFYIQPCVFV